MLIAFCAKRCMRFMNKRSININEVTLGIGSSSINLSYSKKDQEIAYKLWIEMSTRKIGMSYDPKNDVIVEIYNSWYEFFKIARELLKEVPVERILYSSDLIELTEKILNMELRPHLTKWQAKFRKWYDDAIHDYKNTTPQDIQSKYPEYSELVNDLTMTCEGLVEYKKLIKEIAFDNRK